MIEISIKIREHQPAGRMRAEIEVNAPTGTVPSALEQTEVDALYVAVMSFLKERLCRKDVASAQIVEVGEPPNNRP